MADWDPSTSYSPGASVTYQGLPYFRSQFPPTATSGTNPSVEMGVDPKGDAIRTWELRVSSNEVGTYPFLIGYFSLLAAVRSDGIYASEPPLTSYPGKFYPENPYAGETNNQQSAYGSTNFPNYSNAILGESVEMDQFRAATPAIPPFIPARPSAPVMSADKCGVGMQFFQEATVPLPQPLEPYLSSSNGYMGTGIATYQGLTYDSLDDRWYQDFSATPRIFYVFLFFNHPLFFRRQHTITFRISTTVYNTGYTIPGPTPIVVDPTFTSTYSSTTQPVTPTDKNFWTAQASSLDNWIQPSNAITTYTLADNITTAGPYGSTDGTIYEIVEVFVSNVQSND